MKIYRGKHVIEQIDYIDNNKHIPISYVNIPKENELEVSFTPSILFSDKDREVLPYDFYKDNNVVLFDSKNNIKDNLKILHEYKDGGFYYFPDNIKEENPNHFKYRILYKADGIYNESKFYNINVGVKDYDKNNNFTKRIIPLFGKSNQLGISANNVLINKADTDIKTFKNNTKDPDVLFIETDNGIHYKGTNIKIDFEEYKNKNQNIWLICGNDLDNDYVKITKSLNSKTKIDTEYSFSNEYFYSDFEIIKKENVISKKVDITSEDQSLLVLENLNRNYMVFTSKDMLTNIMNNAKAIHEIILYLHLNKYKYGQWKETYIHDFVPDYEYKNNRLVKKKEFKEEIELKNNLEVLKADVDNLDVGFEIKNNSIYFKLKKEKQYKENQGVYSLYTHNKKIVHIDKNQKVYERYQAPKVKKYKFLNNFIHISFSDIIHSRKGIYIDKELKFKKEIDPESLGSIKVFLNINNNTVNFESIPSKDKTLGTIVINVFNDENLYLNDLRQLGGGSSKEDKEREKYNLLDIGNSNGRPIRKGGSMIIELPKKLKKYHERIVKELDKHKIADRQIIIIYKERGLIDE